MCLIGLCSLELSDRAVGWNRCFNVLLPLPVSVGPLDRPQAQGKQALGKDHQKALFPQAWKQSSQHAGKTSLFGEEEAANQ